MRLIFDHPELEYRELFPGIRVCGAGYAETNWIGIGKNRKQGDTWRKIPMQTWRMGYMRLTLPKTPLNNKRLWCIHQLVGLAFYGPKIDPTMQDDHVINNKNDNSINNIQRLTEEEHRAKTAEERKSNGYKHTVIDPEWREHLIKNVVYEHSIPEAEKITGLCETTIKQLRKEAREMGICGTKTKTYLTSSESPEGANCAAGSAPDVTHTTFGQKGWAARTDSTPGLTSLDSAGNATDGLTAP